MHRYVHLCWRGLAVKVIHYGLILTLNPYHVLLAGKGNDHSRLQLILMIQSESYCLICILSLLIEQTRTSRC